MIYKTDLPPNKKKKRRRRRKGGAPGSRKSLLRKEPTLDDSETVVYTSQDSLSNYSEGSDSNSAVGSYYSMNTSVTGGTGGDPLSR